jgi:polyferredoxin
LVKRKIIQIAAALMMNPKLSGFLNGRIYRGEIKKLCVPGLNCYSCPGAVGACPIGSLQSLAGNPERIISFYIYGILLIFGLLLGRFVCGFLCPFGLIQELINKIPLKNWRNKKLFKYLTKVKYIVLGVMVIAIPTFLTIAGEISFPAFCEYLCPAGTLEAGVPLAVLRDSIREELGLLFMWKLLVLAITLLFCIKLYRPFCRFLCPLGAIYSLFNKVSVLHIQCDKTKCDHCGKCKNDCQTEAVNTDDLECIRCGKCVRNCPQKALRWGIKRTKTKENEKDVQNR